MYVKFWYRNLEHNRKVATSQWVICPTVPPRPWTWWWWRTWSRRLHCGCSRSARRTRRASSPWWRSCHRSALRPPPSQQHQTQTRYVCPGPTHLNSTRHKQGTSTSRVWCKTIVTTSFYIRSYNSFAPSPRHAVCVKDVNFFHFLLEILVF